VQPFPLLKKFVPKPMHPLAHRAHRRCVLELALLEFRAKPDRWFDDAELLGRLRYGWGNEGWSAGVQFLTAALQLALEPNQRILECGSGLSTLLMGVCARISGSSVVSLEHSGTWADTVERALHMHLIGHHVKLVRSPLKDYGTYSWYDVPSNVIDPRGFTAVICDGPPSATPGGRFGLLPLMQSSLCPGCTILLDDLNRPQEQLIVTQWASDYGLEYEIEEASNPYARLHVTR
jgi:hypothetical protein